MNGVIAGVQEFERPKEGVAILMCDMWHSAVIDFGCVSFKFRFSYIKLYVMVVFDLTEGDVEEKERF